MLKHRVVHHVFPAWGRLRGRALGRGVRRAGARVGLVVAALLCTPVAQATGPAPPAAAAAALDTQAIDQAVQREMALQNVPGVALAVVYRGELRYAKGYGIADLERQVPVKADSLFAIASVSKPLLALGVARLAEQGKLAWTDPVAKHLPGTPAAWQGITLAHLASHTAGLVRESPAFDGEKLQSDATLVAATYASPLVFPTGTQMQYCNVCYFALAEVISRVSGVPWPQYMEQAIFAPAGMLDTRTTSVTAVLPRRVASYEWQDGRHLNAREYLALRPSGAFMSTVLDLARFEAALQSSRIVSPAMLAQMEAPTLLKDGTPGKIDPASIGYGLGWQVGEAHGQRRLSHGGSLAGFRTLYARYPQSGWAVIVLANSSSARRGPLEAAVTRFLPLQ